MSATFGSSGLRARRQWALGLATLLSAVPAIPGMTESVTRQFVGYTIVGVLAITGYRDKDGTGEDGAFKGCKLRSRNERNIREAKGRQTVRF